MPKLSATQLELLLRTKKEAAAVIDTVRRNKTRKYKSDREACDGMLAVSGEVMLALVQQDALSPFPANAEQEIKQWCLHLAPSDMKTAVIRLPAKAVAIAIALLLMSRTSEKSEQEDKKGIRPIPIFEEKSNREECGNATPTLKDVTEENWGWVLGSDEAIRQTTGWQALEADLASKEPMRILRYFPRKGDTPPTWVPHEALPNGGSVTSSVTDNPVLMFQRRGAIGEEPFFTANVAEIVRFYLPKYKLMLETQSLRFATYHVIVLKAKEG